MRLTRLLTLILFSALSINVSHADGSFGYQDLLALIKDKNVKSIEQLLPLLPQEFHDNQTHAYKSESPEKDEVDAQHPRTILFSADGKLLIAFTNNPFGPSFPKLQAFEFKDDSKAWVPHQLIFKDSEKKSGGLLRIMHEATKVDPNTETTSVHESSNTTCLQCHASDPHPIWQAYPLWPGFYGSNDDVLRPGTKEHAEFSQLKTQNRSATRLKYLHPNLPLQLYPYSETSGEFIELRPNGRLGELLSTLNAKRIARKIKQSPNYQKYKYEFLQKIFCETPNTPEDFTKNISAKIHAELSEKISSNPYGASKVALTTEASVAALNPSAVLYMLKTMFNLSLDDLSLLKKKGSASFTEGVFGLPDLLATEVYRDITTTDKELAPFFKLATFDNTFYESSFYKRLQKIGGGLNFGPNSKAQYNHSNFDIETYKKVCSILSLRVTATKAGSLPAELCAKEATEGSLPLSDGDLEGLKKIATHASPLEACQRCHSANERGKMKIPFEDAVALRKALQKPGYAKGTLLNEIKFRISGPKTIAMPPDKELSPTERKALEDYLDSLAR